MIQYPAPVALMGETFTLTLTDTNRLSGLEAYFGNAEAAPLLVVAGGDFAAFSAAFSEGACTFDPIPLPSGSGAIKITGGGCTCVAFIGEIGAAL